ncbi:MAG: MBL fold metallo-hydrolase [Pseudomonadota bacterium]|nr:MBL fold metallo-hydrolase [Pseudomonadota bacterium]
MAVVAAASLCVLSGPALAQGDAAAPTASTAPGAASSAAPPAASSVVSTASAQAADFTQVPGVYRQRVGDMQVTALFDGVVFLPASDIKGLPPQQAARWLARAHVPQTEQGLQTAVNAYLVRAGGELLLVDTGAATCFGPTLGQVPDQLRAAGVSPDAVRHVLLTHAHPDHICGLLDAGGQPIYRNARVWLSQADADFWLSDAAHARAPQALRELMDMARRAVAPYQASGRFHTFTPGQPGLPAGAQALATPGHTVGHVSWLLGAPGQPQLLVAGDVVHFHAVQFRQPNVSYAFDTDARQANASRQRLLAQAARQGWLVAGAHLPFPGLGRVNAQGKGWQWVPVEFDPTTLTP